MQEWRRIAKNEAKTGALRLLLKILRERYDASRGSMVLADLRLEFDREDRRSQRKAYCGRDFRFRSDDLFEAAIYQLQWEGKIDFVSGDEVLLRTRFPDDRTHIPGIVPPDLALRALIDAIADERVSHWEVANLARAVASADVAAARTVLGQAVKHAQDSPEKLRRLIVIAGNLD